MDIPTSTNTTFIFHDLTPSPFTQIKIMVKNSDGSSSSWEIYMLKSQADVARSMTKTQLVDFLNRQLAETTI